ncbi:MAG: single-stranded-DNA-specific exonuclease RecJ [Candidatus Kerfeldbacteria bacterium]|nr:single-stranded-DNA-specific exonuclease RecJ [Candidatus Kerfeldbacteria bacterium]
MAKRWQLRPPAPPALFEKFPEIDRILLQVLHARRLTSQTEIDLFLDPDYSRDVHDPGLFRDMSKAVERIIQAVRQSEKICIYGDYDADGVCASAVLTETLTQLGVTPEVYIPFRETEGYGMNIAAVEELAAQGTKLIITVDCGSTNVPEVARANALGMDVIITDHHDEPPQLPAAFAIINPELKAETYPYKHLAASGVAYKLATALLRATEYGAGLGREPLPVGWEKWLLDLVATSTVTDMVPMLGENRVFVRYGLDVLRKGRRVGFNQLFTAMRFEREQADEETLGFMIGPRLNAAGRMNHASTAYRLLVTNDQDEAAKLAGELSAANVERQRVTEATVAEALRQIGDSPESMLLSAYGRDWPVGILGLVASRIMEKYQRPTVVMATSQGKIVGSGRSIQAYDITAGLVAVREVLDRFGGHPQACGFTLKPGATPESFTAALGEQAESALTGRDLTPVLDIDAEVILDDISWRLVEDVARLAPFGMQAPRPRFLSRGVRVVSVDTVGKDGKHLRLHVSHATSTVRKTIGFRFGSWVEQLSPGDTVDMVFEAGVNEWNGHREIELKIVDLDHAQS